MENKIEKMIQYYWKRIQEQDTLLEWYKKVDRETHREEIKIHTTKRQCYVQFVEDLKSLIQ